LDEAACRGLRGVSRMAALNIVLEQSPRAYSAAEKTALAAEKNERYRALISALIPSDVEESTRAALSHLKASGLLLAVASGSKNARFILEQTTLTDYFDAIVDGSEITRSKPDPEVFERAVEMMGVLPAEALVVEDAAVGIRAARRGGFFSAALGPDAAAEGLADIELHSLPELLPLLADGGQSENAPLFRYP